MAVSPLALIIDCLHHLHPFHSSFLFSSPILQYSTTPSTPIPPVHRHDRVTASTTTEMESSNKIFHISEDTTDDPLTTTTTTTTGATTTSSPSPVKHQQQTLPLPQPTSLHHPAEIPARSSPRSLSPQQLPTAGTTTTTTTTRRPTKHQPKDTASKFFVDDEDEDQDATVDYADDYDKEQQLQQQPQQQQQGADQPQDRVENGWLQRLVATATTTTSGDTPQDLWKSNASSTPTTPAATLHNATLHNITTSNDSFSRKSSSRSIQEEFLSRSRSLATTTTGSTATSTASIMTGGGSGGVGVGVLGGPATPTRSLTRLPVMPALLEATIQTASRPLNLAIHTAQTAYDKVRVATEDQMTRVMQVYHHHQPSWSCGIISSHLSSPLIPSHILSLRNQRISHGPFIPSEDNMNYYKHLLESASNYEQWYAAASHLDELEGTNHRQASRAHV